MVNSRVMVTNKRFQSVLVRVFLRVTVLSLVVFPFGSCAMESTKKAKVAESSTKKRTPPRQLFHDRLPLSSQDAQGLNLADLTYYSKGKGVVDVTMLAALSLSSNGLTGLPQGFSHMVNLRTFSLAHNQFTQIPSEVCTHTYLTNLDISHNPLTEFPVLQLPGLQVLTAEGVHMHKIPPCLGDVQSLTKLMLSHNELTNVDCELFRLTQLKLLDLSSNKLERLPEQLALLTALKKLYIDANSFEVLPESIGALSQLKLFSANDNQLRALPASFMNLRWLRILFLKNNRLTKIPEDISSLSSLTTLYLDGNPIEVLPESFQKLYCLEILSLTNTPFARLMHTVKYLEKRNVGLVTE